MRQILPIPPECIRCEVARCRTMTNGTSDASRSPPTVIHEGMIPAKCVRCYRERCYSDAGLLRLSVRAAKRPMLCIYAWAQMFRYIAECARSDRYRAAQVR